METADVERMELTYIYNIPAGHRSLPVMTVDILFVCCTFIEFNDIFQTELLSIVSVVSSDISFKTLHNRSILHI